MFVFYNPDLNGTQADEVSNQSLPDMLTWISIRNKITKSTQDAPKFGNGLVQMIKMEKPTGQIRVNVIQFTRERLHKDYI